MSKGQVKIHPDFASAMLEGRVVVNDVDCWLMLVDENEDEIFEYGNYKRGGKPMGKMTAVANDPPDDLFADVSFGWKDCDDLQWLSGGSHKDFQPPHDFEKPKTQWVEQGLIYSKEKNLKVALIDLGGGFDLLNGDLTIKLPNIITPIISRLSFWQRLSNAWATFQVQQKG